MADGGYGGKAGHGGEGPSHFVDNSALAAYTDSHGMVKALHAAHDLLERAMNPAKTAKEDVIPGATLSSARGIAFMFYFKMGAVGSGLAGNGLVIAKKPGSNDWGMPINVRAGGVGGGLELGVAKMYQVITLDTDEAVKTFLSYNFKIEAQAQESVGGETLGSMGMVGPGMHVVYNYVKGIWLGAGILGMVVTPEDKVNAEFYGKDPNDCEAEALVLGDALASYTPHPDIVKLHQLVAKAEAYVHA